MCFLGLPKDLTSLEWRDIQQTGRQETKTKHNVSRTVACLTDTQNSGANIYWLVKLCEMDMWEDDLDGLCSIANDKWRQAMNFRHLVFVVLSRELIVGYHRLSNDLLLVLSDLRIDVVLGEVASRQQQCHIQRLAFVPTRGFKLNHGNCPRVADSSVANDIRHKDLSCIEQPLYKLDYVWDACHFLVLLIDCMSRKSGTLTKTQRFRYLSEYYEPETGWDSRESLNRCVFIKYFTF